MASWSQAQPVIVPGRHVDEPYASLFAGRTSFEDYVAQAKTRVDPVFDDRPFFFATVEALGPAPQDARASSRSCSPCCCRSGCWWSPSASRRGERGRALRAVDRLLREPGHRLHRRGARAAAAPDAAARPPDLHAVDPALHAARLGRPRQLGERALPAAGRVPRRRRPSRRSTPCCCRGWCPRCCRCRSASASRSRSCWWPRSAS